MKYIILSETALREFAEQMRSGIIHNAILVKDLEEMLNEGTAIEMQAPSNAPELVSAMRQEIATYSPCRCGGRGECRKCRVLKI